MSKIIKRSLAEEIAEKLKEQIGSGHYQINDKLPTEPELMAEFGVGRSSIREATKSLVQSGLLRIQQGAGTFVERATINPEPMDARIRRARSQDVDEVRQLLEMKIAEKAAINRSQKDILTMKGYLEDRKTTAEAGLLEACIDADVKFHIAIANASKNEILSDLYKTAAVHLKNWFTEIHPDTRSFIETQHLHERLLKNILDCDSKQAWNTVIEIHQH
ncbi:GntR family transcriptional regulator [Mucilaginibacter sp. SMC90]|uniref:FadR/GntR family transcriptional regulator n=1 Tax=Mucilaginibacter sp. SMC90 TaxID=2929803 RepID=UPI001FB21984|nr:GntR family transcriptional regulator [Mucilaginibacter sp. SMC90]UOE46705.1 GntR family transcriptional regulator [Mucilaginibacter sp. SMC90]